MSGRSTPTCRKMHEPGQRDLQTSTFSISNFDAIIKSVDGLSMSGCSTPTCRKMHEPGQRDLQTSTFSISNFDAINKSIEGLSMSGRSTPTCRKMREPGQRDLQTSTFSISKEVEDLDAKTSRVRSCPDGQSSQLWETGQE